MATLPKGSERVFAVSVKGVAKKANAKGEFGHEVEVDGKAFDSQFPQKFWVPNPDGEQFEPDQWYNVALLSENLKKDKDGSKPWHYWWGWSGFSDAQQPAPASPQAQAASHGGGSTATPPAPAATPRAPWESGDKDRSIQRQTAARIASNLAIAYPNEGSALDAFDLYYRHVLASIENGPSAPEEGQE